METSGNTTTERFAVLLYYCYAPIADTKTFWEEHYDKCLELGLLGRIIIAQEGLNGTVSGTVEACQAYVDYVHGLQGFGETDFKWDYHPGHAFQKLNVRIKDEIVNAGLPQIDPNRKTGKYVEPEELKKFMEDPEVVLLDVRSNYESSVGRFKGAKAMDIENFRDFKDQIDQIEDLKDKKVVTYCTGGIKCEKASAFLLEQGFKDVYPLHGGIIKYGLEQGGEDFEGKCYVFDQRVAVDVNKVNPKVISECYVCGTKTERMVNCANPECNKHTLICDNCGVELEGACSPECQSHPRKRPYRADGYYAKTGEGYKPELGKVHAKKSQEKDTKA